MADKNELVHRWVDFYVTHPEGIHGNRGEFLLAYLDLSEWSLNWSAEHNPSISCIWEENIKHALELLDESTSPYS